MKQKIVIFDLDGTLCELKEESERNNHTRNEIAIDEMYYLYLGFSGVKNILLSGRKEKHRKITEEWLRNNDYHFDEVILQEKSTADKNHIFKREKLIELKEKYDIQAIIDDNPDMVAVCKELSVLLFQVYAPKRNR